jgi:hypothetical protein
MARKTRIPRSLVWLALFIVGVLVAGAVERAAFDERPSP